MANAVERLIYEITAKVKGAVSGFQDVGKAAKKNLGGADDQAKKAAKSFEGMGSAIKSAVTVTAIAGFANSAIHAAEAAATSAARIDQVAVSMGRTKEEAKALTSRLVDLADKTALQTGINQNVIKSVDALLLTFKSLAATADQVGGAFDRASALALDMQATGFGSAEDAAKQLGKALEDPIKGITALRRSGITFTADQQNVIKALVETGQTAKAQKLILDAIQSQVGGVASATANSTDKISVAFSQVSEQIGKALLPALEAVTPALIEFANALHDAAPYLGATGKGLGAMAGGLKATLTPWSKADAGDRLVAGVLSLGSSEATRGLVSLGKAIGGLFGGGKKKPEVLVMTAEAAHDAQLSFQNMYLAYVQTLGHAPPDGGWYDKTSKLAGGMETLADATADVRTQSLGAKAATKALADEGIARVAAVTERATKATEALKAAYDAILGRIDDKQAWLDLQDGFDGVAQAVEDANTAIKNHAKDAEEKLRDARQAVLAQEKQVAEYASTVLGLPPERVTEIIAMIDEGSIAQAEAILQRLTANRDINLYIVEHGGAGYGSITGSTTPRAVGGQVTPGSSYFTGDRGMEFFKPSGVGTIYTNADLYRAISGNNGGGGVMVNASITLNGGATQDDADRIVAALDKWARRRGRTIPGLTTVA